MKVLSIIHYPIFGGPHNRNLQLFDELKNNGVNTTILLPSEKGNALDYLSKAPFMTLPLVRLNKNKSFLFYLTFIFKYVLNIYQIYNVLKNENFEIVQLNGFANIQGAIAGKLAGKKVVIQIIDTYTPSSIIFIYSFFIDYLCDVFMSTGKNVAKKHLKNKLSQRDIYYFYPPVNFDKFNIAKYNKNIERKKLMIKSNNFVIATLGNINKQKGHDYFILMASKIKLLINESKFFIFGACNDNHKEYFNDLKKLAVKNNLIIDKDIYFIDPKGDASRFLAACDLFWFTSPPNSEGIPTSIEEAMTMGLPTISTKIGSINEIVKNNITGFVIKYGDTKSFINKTVKLYDDRLLYKRLSNNCMKFSMENFSIMSCAKRHIAAFKKALS